MRRPGSADGGAPPARGFVLVELLLVVAILAAAAGLAVYLLGDTSDRGAEEATATTLRRVADALLGTPGSAGYLADTGMRPTRLADLYERPPSVAAYDLGTRTGWRGPYLGPPTTTFAPDPARGFVVAYGDAGDPLPLDGWARAVVLQVPDADGNGVSDAEDRAHARLVSAGPDGLLSSPRTDADAGPGGARLPLRSVCGDDVLLFLYVADTRLP